jgi:hypothetical protein
MLLSFPGEILIRILKLLVLPLIISSVLLAVAELDAKQSGKLGRRTLIYYLLTTILAAILGIVLVVSIKPGEANVKHTKPNEGNIEPLDSILDLVRYVFCLHYRLNLEEIAQFCSTCSNLNNSFERVAQTYKSKHLAGVTEFEEQYIEGNC